MLPQDEYKLNLVGYSNFPTRGLTIPIFGSRFDANTLYTAQCYPSGDHRGKIAGFSEIAHDGILPLPAEELVSAGIGSEWIDVLVWGDRIIYGTPSQIWRELKPSIADFRSDIPVVLLDLAINAQADAINSYVRGALRFVRRRFGQAQASDWLGVLIKRETVLELKRFLSRGVEKSTNFRVDLQVSVVALSDNEFRIIIHPDLAEKVDNGRFLLSNFVLDALMRSLDVTIQIYNGGSLNFSSDSRRAREQFLPKNLNELDQQKIFERRDALVDALRIFVGRNDLSVPDLEELVQDVATDVLMELVTDSSIDKVQSRGFETILSIAQGKILGKIRSTQRRMLKEANTADQLAAIAGILNSGTYADHGEAILIRKRLLSDEHLLGLFDLLNEGVTDPLTIQRRLGVTSRSLLRLRQRLLKALT